MQTNFVFCDGACRGNPGPGGFGVVWVWDGFVTELGGYAAHTTNNQMEMTAAIAALHEAFEVQKKTQPLTIFSDSQYLIFGMTGWLAGWKKNGRLLPGPDQVANVQLWLQLDKLCTHRKIEWKHVRGHRGFAGNERADGIATAFASKKVCELFVGPLQNYTYNLNQLLQGTKG
jgi:ribonuclease HI